MLSEERILYLRQIVTPATTKSPRRGCSESGRKNSPEQDSYFDFLIRDVLSQIRHGEVDYVFTEQHLLELLRYEPNLRIEWDTSAECYSVSL